MDIFSVKDFSAGNDGKLASSTSTCLQGSKSWVKRRVAFRL